VLLDLLEGFGTVQMLASGDEPNFQVGEIDHLNLSSFVVRL
jgi:hypothetical protein